MNGVLIFDTNTDLYLSEDGEWVDSINNAFHFSTVEQAEKYLKHMGVDFLNYSSMIMEVCDQNDRLTSAIQN